MTPEQAARARLQAIEALQAQLSGYVDTAQRELLSGLLTRLQETLDDPLALAPLLAEYTQAVAVPLALAYAESLLTLPGLQVDYFASLGLTNYAALKRPLASFLETRFGITAAGEIVPGGYLSTLVGDTTAQRALLQYAYQAQASGVGLAGYRAGLEQLVVGNGPGKGLMHALYQEAYDTYNQADRALSQVAAKELGLQAYLYQGGLIKSSRLFCRKRDGKVFTDFEIARFGTSKDAYGGYTNKAEGMFSGKSEPYDPVVDLGGYGCRHGLSPIPNVVALRMRADLGEDKDGKLYIKTA